MNFHVLTIFPDLFAPYMQASILGRACQNGLLHFQAHDLRSYTHDVHRRVDDRPYGGGSGMVMKPDVLVEAIRSLRREQSISKVILLSPRGKLLTDPLARAYASCSSLLFVSARYEGVDQRAIDLEIDEELSIGDYVLTGGELPSLIAMDVIARFVPGVIPKPDGPENESHAKGLLEYPHYTRPPLFEGLAVPEVLLSGHHVEIEKWKQAESEKLTQEKRPDLWEKYFLPR